MTTLKTLYQIGEGYEDEVTRNCVMLEITQDRQATADVLCALLDKEPTINLMVLKERVVNIIRATLSNEDV